jgi:DNA-binding NtrC family response regulator
MAEVLVVDGDEKVQRGLAQMLAAAGLVPTVMTDPERARALASEKYFPVAVIDLDTPAANEGLSLVRWFKEESPITATFVICSRKVFESAVEAFRAGAIDIVVKAPDQVELLKQRILEAVNAAHTRVTEERLLGEALSVHEEFLKRLMDASRRLSELEERLSGHPGDGDGDCHVCVVEPNDGDWLFSALNQLLRGRDGYVLRHASSGSEAMDLAGRSRFNIALVSSQLPDLPSSMVLSALKQQSPDTIAIVYSRPGTTVGRAEIVDGSKAILMIAELTDPRQMVARIDELREAQLRTARERRYLGRFRQENYELLRKYAELKQKLQSK